MARDYTVKAPPGSAAAADGFWAFSLRVYAAEGVESACLALQERHGIDVNLLLLACWCAATGRGALAAADCRALKAQSEPWQSRVVRSLRGVRRELKARQDESGVSELRKAVAACELEAERLEQRMLEAVLESRVPHERPRAERRRDAAAGLLGCLHAAQAPVAERELAELAVLLQAAVPPTDGTQARSALEAAIAGA